VQGLRADVARLPLRVVRARLDRDRDGLLVFFVGVVLLGVAAAVDPFTNLLVAAAPVVMLARGITISHLTHRGAVWASGAAQAAQFVRIILRFAVSYWVCAALTRLGKPDFVAG